MLPDTALRASTIWGPIGWGRPGWPTPPLRRSARRVDRSAASHGLLGELHEHLTFIDVTVGRDPSRWEIVTTEDHTRTLTTSGGQVVPLHDVVVRAMRRS